MQPLYTETELREATSRQLLPLKCLHCSKTFLKNKHNIQTSPRHRGTNDFCGTICSNSHRNPPIIVQCHHCHKAFRKEPCQISQHNFCCRSCAAKWNNAHKTKGARISKLEIWLASKLPTLYPGLEFHFNRRDAINGELDIYIPALKLAFELNGVFHYEPIYGPDKLASIQNNDARKAQACLEHGIELCLIDVSTISYFKEQRAMEFLPIVTTIIDSKLSGSSPVILTA